ncbi:putative RNA methyltransferase [Sphaerisporangium krabiense]|uniref:tRNA/tmRNA/rRNA uracil-C5-methylase (TrmA/RlmC/RlmD family) n=1 Tax=Sphaerisporangium krabiense TaxID=763782 RepID=A0A7W8ZAN0_9ACTN|nr:class I SAM-dependent RNA methyltransferase [Sphaerisporangium krabiense]MBB5630395.1 tRNA/tmRNA/rRNA uracil-C5-methylase (TrmA/RlmC/RlmD family) [Sphaerisporangium krabiense]GII62650.1 putative RNA methyltransferase [Sphaerisporangium krabiense]
MPIELDVERVANGGWCVARHEGRVVFVRHALPGERVLAEVTDETTRFLRADAVEILDASPDRVTPPCPFAGPGRCGGCDWQHATLAAQRGFKADILAEQLRRLAGIEVKVDVEEVPGSPKGLGWRTRVQFAVTPDGHPGLRRHRSHEVEPVDACLIAHPEVERIGVERDNWRGATAVEGIASSTGERAVVVTPKGHRTVAVPELGADAYVLVDEGRGHVRAVRGRTALTERVGAREFRVTGSGFWQVHPGAAAVLLEAVMEFAAVRPGDWALDLYCGVGLFAAGLAEATGPEGAVLGIESDARAVQDARHNLRDLHQARVERGRVEDTLDRLGVERADVVVVDPPRTGLGRDVVTRVAALDAARIVYVSCDPATLARDLAWFADHGYPLVDLRAFDAFPMTHHVEAVALLVKDPS